MKTLVVTLSITLLGLAAPVALAAENDEPGAHQSNDATAPGHAAHGKVNSVDAADGKVNISHDAIKSLKWPKMTMDFTVHDPAVLKDIKPGMEVDFELTEMGGGYQVVKITPVN